MGTYNQLVTKNSSSPEKTTQAADKQVIYAQKEPVVDTKPAITDDSKPPRNHDTVIPSNHDTTIPSNHDIFETVRRSVKTLGKEPATHRFTRDEKERVGEIIYQYKRQGIRTSENEITRIALNYLLEEYSQAGEESILARVISDLNH